MTLPKSAWFTRTRGALLAPLVLLAAAQVWLSPTPASAVPSDFEDAFLATVSGPTDLTFTPDGRMLVTGKAGQLRVIAGGTLLAQPAIDLAALMCTNGERGLVSVTTHPNFAANRFIYLYYTFNKYGTCNESEIDGPVNRLSRFMLPDTNVIDPASEVVLFDTPPMFRDHHTGGDTKFGTDGNLYVTVGDGGTARFGWSQDPGRLFGKIVRLTDTGDIPTGNPFTGAGTARCNVNGVPPAGSPAGTKCQEVFTQGLRNPFRFAFDPNAAGVRYFINDVGQHTWEDISEGPLPGGDYGWPVREGPCAQDSTTDCGPPPAGMTNPVHWYQHGPNGAAVTAGAFVPNGIWPASYDGGYLFGDYVFGKIYLLKPGGTACPTCSPPTSAYIQTDFSDSPAVVAMEFGPHGAGQALYYVNRDGSEVRRIAYTGSSNRAPVARATADPMSGDVPLLVRFDGRSSSDPDNDPLTYAWDFQGDGVTDSTASDLTYEYQTAGTYFAKLTVSDGLGGENSTTLRIDAGNTPPTPVIETPADGTLFRVGQQFTLHGSATDGQDPSIPNSSLSWEVLQHHAQHTHPFLEPTPGNDITITAPEPEDFDAATNSYLEIKLTATDSNGLSTTVTRDIRPKTVNVTFQSNPSGLDVTVNGATITTPSTELSWEAYNLEVNAPNQNDGSGNPFVFDSWSDGGAQAHTIITPASPSTYTANFSPGGGGGTPTTQTFPALADTYAKADEIDRNFGTSSQIRVDGSPDLRGFLRFDPDGLGSPITQATLRIFANSNHSLGADVRKVTDSTWGETTLTYRNMPGVGPVTASSGRITANTWVEWNVTSLLSGNDPVSFALTTTSSTAMGFASRETSATTRPVLVVTHGGGGGGDTTRPTAPTGLSATAVSPGQVNLTWNASTDNVGVTGYDIFRNGSLHATTTGVTSYSDTTVVSTTTYQYQVRARDGAGNVSDFSNAATVTTPDGIPPSAPTGLTASAVSSTRVDLAWNASTDNVGVTGYDIFRNGTLLATWGIFEAYSDTTVSPSTTYQYQVRARDEAGNRSEFSNTATVTTPGTGGTPTTRIFYALADTYAKADEIDRNFGTSSQIRVDGSPDIRGFLRFDPDNLGTPIVRATLRIYANSNHSTGLDARGVSDITWGETTLTYRNMPGVGPVTASSGKITASTWIEFNVTSLVLGNDPVSFALTTTSSTASSLAAKETGLTRPELVVSYG